MRVQALASNEVMLGMFKHRNFEVVKRDGASYEVELKLRSGNES